MSDSTVAAEKGLCVHCMELCGIPVERLVLEKARVTCIPDPETVAWDCASLLPGMSAKMLADAAPRLPHEALDAASGTINISFSTFLVELPDVTILVDTGIGNDKTRDGRPLWHRRAGPYLTILDALGVKPESVDIVVNTHLHADHVGWNTRLRNGRWEPTFPNARYLTSDAELAHWEKEFAADPSLLLGSFADSIAPLLERGLLEGLPSDAEIAPGVSFSPAPGHTHGMVTVRIERSGTVVELLADSIHHPVQFVYPEVCTRACLDLQAAQDSRRNVLDRCAREGAVVAATHFPAPYFGRIVRQGDSFGFVPLPTDAP